MPSKTAIIIGAGPAGLTAAYELLTRTNIRPIVLERSSYMGGISRTVNYKGNRMDIGGHRFFSKSDRVMQWWLAQLRIARDGEADSCDDLMLARSRTSRIYFLRRFFDYPIKFTAETLRKLGWQRSLRIVLSYLRSALFPIKYVRNLEEFLINRFGRELYFTFFKSYTEKVWGIACEQISAEWGAQRIKGLSIRKAVTHFIRQAAHGNGGIRQKGTETSLIEQFLYPKFGPGQMWERVAKQIVEAGGQIITNFNVTGVEVGGTRLTAVTGTDVSGREKRFVGDLFFSTTSVQELIRALRTDVPASAHEVAEGLQYRDFVVVGLLMKKLKLKDRGDNCPQLIPDNWIYIQESDVQLGRLQIFNNWSPYVVADPSKVWLGAEYFCREGDQLWRKADDEMARQAIEELARIDIIDEADVLDFTVARMPKAYPAYFGAYQQFEHVRRYLDRFENLFLVGRNGMHKYNNQDHSMLTAMIAVDNIIAGREEKANIWEVNTETEYHESKS